MPGGNREIWILQYYLNTINEKLGGNGLEQLMLGLRSEALLTREDIDSFESTKPRALQTLWLIETLLKRDNLDEDFNDFMWCLEKIGCDHEDQNPGEPNCFLELWDFLKTVQQSLEECRSSTEATERRQTCASRQEYKAAKGSEYYKRTAQGHARGPRCREASESEDLYEQYTRNFCELRRRITILLNGFAKELELPINDNYDYADDTDVPSAPDQIPPRPPPIPQIPDTQTVDEDSHGNGNSDNSDTSTDEDRQSLTSVDTSSLSSGLESRRSIIESDDDTFSIATSVSSMFHTCSPSHPRVEPTENDQTDEETYDDTIPETQYSVSSTLPLQPPSDSDSEIYAATTCEEDPYDSRPDTPTTPYYGVPLQFNVSYSTTTQSENPSGDNSGLYGEAIYADVDNIYPSAWDPPSVRTSLSNTEEQIYKEISPAALQSSGKMKTTVTTTGCAPVGSPGHHSIGTWSQKGQVGAKAASVTYSTMVTDLTDEEWISTQLEQKTIKKLLAGTSPGTFLVTTTATDSTLVLYAVNESKRMAYMTITRKNGFYCLNGGKKFTTLRELVRYYQQHRIKGDLQLKKPLCLEDSVSKKVPFLLKSKSILSTKCTRHEKKLASSFGSHLYDGKYKDTTVIFKVATTQQGMKGITNEALILPTLSHPNVVKMVGLTISGSWPTLILQHIRYQTLRDYLASTKHETKVTQASRIIIDICAAMEYLEKNKVVHCALNAENCLVQKDGSAILANFSLSHSVVDERYIIPHDSPPLPPECQPPEVVYGRWYTAMSDVWAFGILVYEIYGNDGTQCPTFTSPDTCKLPPKPNSMSEDVYAITTRCWRYNQYDRPTFTELKTKLQRVLHINTTV